MALNERVYSVLIVSAAERFNGTVPDLFPGYKYAPVHIVTNISAAKRACADREFDFVIINSPLPDDSGVRFAIDTVNECPSVVLLLVRAELYEEIYDKSAEYGVFLLSKPSSLAILQRSLDWLASARERLRKTEKKALSIEEKMNEIRQVNRAKWLLIRELNMDEPSAHRYIEKQAMDRCVPRRQVAEEIIKTYT